jgi:hypothetical protein
LRIARLRKRLVLRPAPDAFAVSAGCTRSPVLTAEHQRRLWVRRSALLQRGVVVELDLGIASTATATGCSPSTGGRPIDGDQIVMILALDLEVDLVAMP